METDTFTLLQEQNDLLLESNELLLDLVTEQNEVLTSIYATNLFTIGITSAIFVCVLLYKFIKLFY